MEGHQTALTYSFLLVMPSGWAIFRRHTSPSQDEARIPTRADGFPKAGARTATGHAKAVPLGGEPTSYPYLNS